MTQLVGFVPSIELEMRFTGLELLHLLHGSKMHYDGDCKAASMHAYTKDGITRRKNGVIIRAMMHLGRQYGDYMIRNSDVSDEDYLSANLDAESNISLTWREVDLLCKITECFNLIAGMPRLPEHFSMDVATSIFMGLRQALTHAGRQSDALQQQEKLRRESCKKSPQKIIEEDDPEMLAAERAVYGNVCRLCNRDIKGRLKVANRDADGWPACQECYKPS
jgi:hypothetical protein